MIQVRALAERLWSQLRCDCRKVSHNNFAACSASSNITRASFAIRADLSHRGPVGDCRLSPIERRFCPRVRLIIYLASACFFAWDRERRAAQRHKQCKSFSMSASTSPSWRSLLDRSYGAGTRLRRSPPLSGPLRLYRVTSFGRVRYGR